MIDEKHGTALVTGAARRIGRAIALALHEAGYDIALHYRSSESDAQSLAEALNNKRPASCTLHRADLADRSALAAVAVEIRDAHPHLAVLVNNASGFRAKDFVSTDEALFDAMVDSNLRGAYFLTQALLPNMDDGACIINILDMHLDRPLRGYSAYTAAKAGLESLTRSLAVELAPAIRVNGIAPGVMLWPEEDSVFDENLRKATLDRTPLQRMGDPTDIALTARFLVCDAPFVTGQVITVDGGLSLT